MFGVSFTELIVVLIVAIIVVGPRDLPIVMRAAGRMFGKAKKFSSEFMNALNAEAGNPTGVIRDLKGNLQETYEVPKFKKPKKKK